MDGVTQPTAERTSAWPTRLVGLVVVIVGLWLFASVTLGYDLPTFDWHLAWPAILIGLGVVIIGSAVARRR
jgi:uncharacterized integral membrane protein